MINLMHLEYIIEIAECGSINQAARNLYVSQPYLTKIIHSLEKELGFTIFDRGQFGVVPTMAGEQLLHIATIIMREVERAYKIPQSIELKESFSIVTTFSSILMRSFLAFKKSYANPSIKDSIRETSMRQALNDITSGSYRLAFITCHISRVDHYIDFASNQQLALKVLRSGIPLVALLSKSHPLSDHKMLDLAEIFSCQLVCYDNYPFEDMFGSTWPSQEDNVFYVYDRGGLIDVVKEENFLAPIMQDSSAMIGANNMVEIPIKEMTESLCVCMMHPNTYKLSDRELEFVHFYKTRLNQAYGGVSGR